MMMDITSDLRAEVPQDDKTRLFLFESAPERDTSALLCVPESYRFYPPVIAASVFS